MRKTVAAVAAASTVALGGALVAPPQEAQAASHSILGGTAVDPEGIVRALPGGDILWNGTVITPGVKDFVGDTTSIAVLPLSFAVTFAGQGERATAFSLIGLALATTDASILGIINIPSGQVACLGLLTFASSSTDGTCVNALGVLAGNHNPADQSISGALVNPLGALNLLTSPGDTLGDLIGGIITGDGQSIQKLLTDDFVRLGFSAGGRTGAYGLPSLVSLTSDYGLINPIVVNWLGQTATIFPAIASSTGTPSTPNPGGNVATPNTPNYLGFPDVQFNAFDPSQIIPSISGLSFDNIRFPGENLLALAQLIGDIIGGGGLPTLPFTAGLPTSDPAATSAARTATNSFVTSLQTQLKTGVPSTLNAPQAGTPATQSNVGVPTQARSQVQSVQPQTQQSPTQNWQQRSQTWKEQRQSWAPSWKPPSSQGTGGQNTWSAPSRPQLPFNSVPKSFSGPTGAPSFGTSTPDGTSSAPGGTTGPSSSGGNAN
ncbi:hypothetical protein [Gordonia araii]|nr:hypothetical protein [Gordonia araii]NNG98869.1 hypothetical protein [Gordonia araii NBRC 100433]